LALIRNQLIKDTFLKFGIDPNNIPSLVEQIARNRVRQFRVETDFSPRFKEVIKLATKEANSSFQQEITQVDLLIGIVREEGIGAKVLASLGLTKDKLHELKHT
jgi:ATP-dependent Clp protease ATP-binding subunit ClpA